jgi:hypothetical protein
VAYFEDGPKPTWVKRARAALVSRPPSDAAPAKPPKYTRDGAPTGFYVFMGGPSLYCDNPTCGRVIQPEDADAHRQTHAKPDAPGLTNEQVRELLDEGIELGRAYAKEAAKTRPNYRPDAPEPLKPSDFAAIMDFGEPDAPEAKCVCGGPETPPHRAWCPRAAKKEDES